MSELWPCTPKALSRGLAKRARAQSLRLWLTVEGSLEFRVLGFGVGLTVEGSGMKLEALGGLRV